MWVAEQDGTPWVNAAVAYRYTDPTRQPEVVDYARIRETRTGPLERPDEAADTAGRAPYVVQKPPAPYTEVRIANRLGAAIDSLTMNTNQDTLLFVTARNAVTGQWEQVIGHWTLSGEVDNNCRSEYAHEWPMAPSGTGSGCIRVSMDNPHTRPDSVRLTSVMGPPLAVELEVLTAAEQRRAEEPLDVEIRLYNRNGPPTGLWCAGNDSEYHATFAAITGGRQRVPLTVSAPERLCFTDGTARVTVRMDRLPGTEDMPYMLSVDLGDFTDAALLYLLPPRAVGGDGRAAAPPGNGQGIAAIGRPGSEKGGAAW
jgi:hypothetical protein